MRKTERLRKEADFQQTLSRGERFNTRFFVLHIFKRPRLMKRQAPCENSGRRVSEKAPIPNRIGFVVSKKVGNAVTRNRVKRFLREAYRQEKGKCQSGRDLVLVAKRGAGVLSFSEVQAALSDLFRESGLSKVSDKK